MPVIVNSQLIKAFKKPAVVKRRFKIASTVIPIKDFKMVVLATKFYCIKISLLIDITIFFKQCMHCTYAPTAIVAEHSRYHQIIRSRLSKTKACDTLYTNRIHAPTNIVLEHSVLDKIIPSCLSTAAPETPHALTKHIHPPPPYYGSDRFFLRG